MNEFILYNRIINGDLRPHLKIYSEEKGLRSLEKIFFTLNGVFRKDKDGSTIFDIGDALSYIKPGDQLMLTFDPDDVNSKNIVEIIPNPFESELINIDIPPPIDRKSEIYFRIIEEEFLKIEHNLTKRLYDSKSINDLKDYALINLQCAKKLGKESHILEKQLKIPDIDNFHNPNTLILYSLKRHIIYSIMLIQELYGPFLENPIPSQYELEDELFENCSTKMSNRIEGMNKSFDKIKLNKLYKDLGNDVSTDKLIDFFRLKASEQLDKIENELKSRGCVSTNLISDKKLYLKELGKILDKEICNVHFANSGESDTERYKRLLKLITKYEIEPNSIDSLALKTTDIFTKMKKELRTLKKVIDVSGLKKNNLLNDLISISQTIQARKNYVRKEDEWNDYLSDLLRARDYYIADQSRSGKSGSKRNAIVSSGELDLSIRDLENNGRILSIIESLKLNSCGSKNSTLKEHIEKLVLKYDTSGNQENYLIIYSTAASYSTLCKNYYEYMNNISLSYMKSFEYIDVAHSNFSDIKVGKNIVEREESELFLYHILINMKC